MLEVGIQEVPVSTEGNSFNVIVTRSPNKPSIPVLVNVTTRLAIINPDDLIPGISLASGDGKPSL